jgi:hypothetical protein
MQIRMKSELEGSEMGGEEGGARITEFCYPD